MQYGMYSIKDVVVGNFGQIQLFNNDHAAKRWFLNLCKTTDVAGDLELFKVGVFDVETGEILPALEFLIGGTKKVDE